jgi:hypothetical protein
MKKFKQMERVHAVRTGEFACTDCVEEDEKRGWEGERTGEK